MFFFSSRYFYYAQNNEFSYYNIPSNIYIYMKKKLVNASPHAQSVGNLQVYNIFNTISPVLFLTNKKLHSSACFFFLSTKTHLRSSFSPFILDRDPYFNLSSIISFIQTVCVHRTSAIYLVIMSYGGSV